MLKVATAKEMQEIDRLTIEKYGITGTVLMERAGLAVVKRINELFFQTTVNRQLSTVNCQPSTVLILCGGGNNGGDGLVVARILHEQGKDVTVFLSAKPEELKGDVKINYHTAKNFGVKIYPINKFLTSHFSLLTSHFIIVDALLGTGLNKDVKSPLKEVIEKANKLKCTVVSVDIPSGISSDTGQIMGCAVKAEYTVTFGLPKRGHLLYPGAEYTGKLFIEDIGFPKKLLEVKSLNICLFQKKDALSLLPERPRYSHKGTYGHVLLIAGSKGKTGAAFMAAKACLRTGAGLVTIGAPESLVNIFQSRVTEEMVLPLPDKGNGTLSYNAADLILNFARQKADVLAIGPGLSTDDEISRLVNLLTTKSGVPIVIDADGINAIAGHADIFKKSKMPIILTPHPGEMARLINSEQLTVNSEQIEKDRINTALSFSKRTKTYLVLKGVPTITASPDGSAFINTTGNPGMATAGTGDVLTGIISALLAQRLEPQNAALLGVYMHGFIGDIAAETKGEHSLIASDIINLIPEVFKLIKSSPV
ncbi:MAG: NAD(P)H-hydrate dehydratase [Nitrospirae bacterium]|nr:NAD(P)H-hydrate dehydratase [Nitrospirota bacterium]